MMTKAIRGCHRNRQVCSCNRNNQPSLSETPRVLNTYVIDMDDEDGGPPPPIPSRPVRTPAAASGMTSQLPGGIPQIPPRPFIRARSKSPGKLPMTLLLLMRGRAVETSSDDLSSIPAVSPRPSHKHVDPDIPTIPARPSRRPAHQQIERAPDIPPIPQRPPKRDPEQTPVQDLGDDYMIDGIEKRVPLLPATSDAEDLTPSLQELIIPPEIPRRPVHLEVHEDYDDVPVIPERPIRRSASGDGNVPVIPRRPVRKTSIESPVDEPSIPRRPSQRSRVYVEDDEPPAIPHRPAGRPASVKSTTSQDPEEPHPMLSTFKSTDSVVSQESSEPIIPPRPTRKPITKSLPENPAVGDVKESEPVIPPRPTRKSSIKSALDQAPEIYEEPGPIIPPRPTRKSSIRSIPEPVLEIHEEPEPIIPPRPVQKSSIKSIPETPEMAPDRELEAEPVIPPRPTRVSSIKSIAETPEFVPDGEHDAEPVTPPQPPRVSSIKSIPETPATAPDDECDLGPIIPPRPTRKSSTKSISQATEPLPAIPQRPTRTSSITSFKSQHSMDEEPESEQVHGGISAKSVEKVVETNDVPIETEEMEAPPSIPYPPKNIRVDETVEPELLAPPIEEVPAPQNQHPIITESETTEPTVPILPHEPKAEDSIPAIPPRPKKGTTERTLPESTPTIPSRPKKHEEPALRTAGIAALITQPIIPPRPQKFKSHLLPHVDSVPKVAMDQTRELVSTSGGGIFESVEAPIDSNQRHIDPESNLDMEHSGTTESAALPTKEAATPASELQAEVAAKLTKTKSPPVPARPQHKLARQFEHQVVKEKPIPPPRPMKPVLAGGSKFAGLRAQFAKDLNERLAKPPPPPPSKKEEVHSMESEPVLTETKAAETGENATGKVEDMRKGRAKGPVRRPPTVKPIVPAGWGVSEIAIVFEQKSQSEVAEQKNETEMQMEKTGRKTQTEERITSGDDGVRSLYVEGKVRDAGNRVGHPVEPMETSAVEEPVVAGKEEIKEPLEEVKAVNDEPVEVKDKEPVESEGVVLTDEAPCEIDQIRDMEVGHGRLRMEAPEQAQAKGEEVQE